MPDTPHFSVPFGGRSHAYTEKEIEKVRQIMRDSTGLTQGQEQDIFENKFATFLGVEKAHAVSNATAGLEIAAQLCDFRDGDEVVIPAHTFTSSAYPFAKHGAQLIWADIDPSTRVVSVEQIEPCLSKKTRAIVVPHLYGYGADMPGIMEIAEKYSALVIEDVAQAIGVRIDGKMAGAYGDFSVFSFHAHKNISTLGEGGALVARDEDHSRLIPQLRHNGHCNFTQPREGYWIPAMGNVDLPSLNEKALLPNNFCLGEVQCALGAMLLDRVEKINCDKRQRALRFIDTCSEKPQLEFHREDSPRHNYHLLVAKIATGNRDEFIRAMAFDHGIQCIVQYYPLYRYSFYRKLGLGKAKCPNTDEFFDNMVSFPFHHTLEEDQIEQIVRAVTSVLAKV